MAGFSTKEDFADKDETDVYLFLMDKGFEENVAKVFQQHDVDGISFLELSMDELNRLFPDKLGTVKKVYRLIQSILAKSSSPPAGGPSRLPVSPPNSVFSGLSCNEDTLSMTSSSSARAAAVSPSPVNVPGQRKFVLPDTWRPSIMHAIQAPDDSERRKRLTPDLKNALVRDVVSTMQAYMSQPNKEFCTQVAKQLVTKYSFMKDVGTYNTGYGSWEKKIIERVHNVGKHKKRDGESVSAPQAKRGRPHKNDSSMLQRYPPLQIGSADSGEAAEALGKELEKEKPRKDIVLPLFKQTFPERRQHILSTQTSVADIAQQYKALTLPYALEQEVDTILKKKDVVKTACEDWKEKWTQAILSYAQTLKSKPVKNALRTVETKFAGDEEETEKKALFVLLALMSKGDPTERLTYVLGDHQAGEDPNVKASEASTSGPVIGCFKDVDGSNSYYLFVEKKVLCGGVLNFCKSLSMWFSLHYVFNLEYDKPVCDVALFFQEFVFGLPASKVKKTSTYLTVSSDIQSFTIVVGLLILILLFTLVTTTLVLIYLRSRCIKPGQTRSVAETADHILGNPDSGNLCSANSSFEHISSCRYASADASPGPVYALPTTIHRPVCTMERDEQDSTEIIRDQASVFNCPAKC